MCKVAVVKNINVSIIVPIYNTQDYIERCLNSLINQTLKDIEIICVNDGSTDDSLKILEEFAKVDDRIIVLTQENAGVSVARNAGLNIAKGEYIGFIDSDDWIDLDYYENLYNTAIRNDCEIAVTNVVRKKESTQKYKIKYDSEQVYEDLQKKLNICDIPNCCYTVNKIYKSEIIKDLKFKEGVLFEDVLWLPEIIKGCNKLVTVPSIVYYYWVNNNSIVRSKSTPKRELDSYNAKKYIVQFFDENNLELSKKERNITKSIKYLFNFPILKIKEYNNNETCYLFSFLPIPFNLEWNR